MLIVLTTAALLVVLCVAVHLLVLEWLLGFALKAKSRSKVRLAAMMLGAIAGHVVEMGIFAMGLHFLARSGEFGHIAGAGNGFMDNFYYSAVTYTTLGYGDLTPVGPLRFFAAIEALTGLVLVAWTASFAFAALQRMWPQER